MLVVAGVFLFVSRPYPFLNLGRTCLSVCFSNPPSWPQVLLLRAFSFCLPFPFLPLDRGCFLVVSLTRSLGRRCFLLRGLFVYSTLVAACVFGFVSQTRVLAAGTFLFVS